MNYGNLFACLSPQRSWLPLSTTFADFRRMNRSVRGGQPNDDENRVVLLVAAINGRHGRPRIHRKTLRGSVRRRARVGSLRRRVACGAASEMGDIVEGRAVGETLYD